MWPISSSLPTSRCTLNGYLAHVHCVRRLPILSTRPPLVIHRDQPFACTATQPVRLNLASSSTARWFSVCALLRRLPTCFFRMVRLLYRLLRAFNFVGSVNENQRRSAMRSSALLRDLIVADLEKPLSYSLPMTGNAMSPIFNANVSDMCTAHDRLVIRRLSGSTQSFLNRVYVDDVVVITDPNDARRKYVRRISAMEGAQMHSVHGDPPFSIPKSHCWVERENTQADAPDSSSFGPLSLQNVIGRVMYAIRSATDHGRVKNSPYAMASDSIVLAHENVSKHFESPPPSQSPSQSQSGTQDKSN